MKWYIYGLPPTDYFDLAIPAEEFALWMQTKSKINLIDDTDEDDWEDQFNLQDFIRDARGARIALNKANPTKDWVTRLFVATLPTFDETEGMNLVFWIKSNTNGMVYVASQQPLHLGFELAEEQNEELSKE